MPLAVTMSSSCAPGERQRLICGNCREHLQPEAFIKYKPKAFLATHRDSFAWNWALSSKLLGCLLLSPSPSAMVEGIHIPEMASRILVSPCPCGQLSFLKHHFQTVTPLPQDQQQTLVIYNIHSKLLRLDLKTLYNLTPKYPIFFFSPSYSLVYLIILSPIQEMLIPSRVVPFTQMSLSSPLS